MVKKDAWRVPGALTLSLNLARLTAKCVKKAADWESNRRLPQARSKKQIWQTGISW